MTEIHAKYLYLIAITGIISAIYGLLLIRDWWKSGPTERRRQALNVWTLLPIMALAQYFVAGYLFNLSQPVETWTKDFDPLILIFAGLIAAPGGLALLVHAVRKKTPEYAERMQELLQYAPDNRKEAIKRDFTRKITHIIQFGVIFAIDLIGFNILTALFPTPETIQQSRLIFWGIAPGVNYITFSWTWAGWGDPSAQVGESRVLFFAFFYCLFYFMITSELCRHSERWRFLFDRTIHKSLRRDEAGRKIASYALFPAGYMFACLFLPYFAVVGIIAGGCLGDLAASQVGMRWGRHRFPHQHKTWEGLAAGSIVTFCAGLLFLGPIWALILAGCFAFVDLISEWPVPMSDNLLFPIVCTVVFCLLPLAGLQISPLIIAMAG
jgi:dolichol kinase